MEALPSMDSPLLELSEASGWVQRSHKSQWRQRMGEGRSGGESAKWGSVPGWVREQCREGQAAEVTLPLLPKAPGPTGCSHKCQVEDLSMALADMEGGKVCFAGPRPSLDSQLGSKAGSWMPCNKCPSLGPSIRDTGNLPSAVRPHLIPSPKSKRST